jgi:hypothetical protein
MIIKLKTRGRLTVMATFTFFPCVNIGGIKITMLDKISNTMADLLIIIKILSPLYNKIKLYYSCA